MFQVTSSGGYTVLYNFDVGHGSQPVAPLIQGKDGNFYGTTVVGGANGAGVVFKITAKGVLTVLHNFDSASMDGYNPFAGLVQATDGNLYGATHAGGASGFGTLYRISPKGTGYLTRYSFDGTTAGFPQVTLLQHTNGVLYGLSQIGGIVTPNFTSGAGTFYSLDEGLSPFASLVSTSGPVGSPVGIRGQRFTGAKKVSFAGVLAVATVLSDTYLTTTVPTGAKTGFVTVKRPSGPLKSNKKFLVIPVVQGFSPLSGPVGTSVTIAGSGLIQITKVTFGGVTATNFTVNSDAQVTATVPAGATTGKIEVTTPGGKATSSASFTVTP